MNDHLSCYVTWPARAACWRCRVLVKTSCWENSLSSSQPALSSSFYWRLHLPWLYTTWAHDGGKHTYWHRPLSSQSTKTCWQQTSQADCVYVCVCELCKSTPLVPSWQNFAWFLFLEGRIQLVSFNLKHFMVILPIEECCSKVLKTHDWAARTLQWAVYEREKVWECVREWEREGAVAGISLFICPSLDRRSVMFSLHFDLVRERSMPGALSITSPNRGRLRFFVFCRTQNNKRIFVTKYWWK